MRGPAFAEVAKAKSDGFTAKEGGVHDWTTKGALTSAAIDEALFSLRDRPDEPDPGKRRRVSTSCACWSARKPGRKPFTDVQAKIREKLKEERFQAGVEKYLGEAPPRRPHLDGLHGQHLGRRAAGPQAGRDADAVSSQTTAANRAAACSLIATCNSHFSAQAG